MSETKTCPICGGEGLMYEHPGVPHCTACGGCGEVAIDGSRLEVLSHGESVLSGKGVLVQKAAERMGSEAFKAMLLDPCKLTPALDAAVTDYLEAAGKSALSVPKVRPAWARGIKDGDWLTIKDGFMTRGGQTGRVVGDPTAKGASLDFYCDVSGDPRGLPTIEFWEWDEIDAELLPAVTQ